MSVGKKLIYLDHAATTSLDSQVLKVMRPFLTTEFGNPSALYDLGVRARQTIEASRKKVADIFHTTSDTIIFTSGGTEANNLAILGFARAHGKPGHIITTPIEHDSVLGPIENLKQRGWKITYLPVDNHGLINPEDVKKSLQSDRAPLFVSIIYANNEIGTIEPIADVGRILLRYRKEHNTPYPYFQVDACQAAGYLDLDVEKLHVDLMTINGSKIYGPKGAGVLYIRRGVKLESTMFGGDQERGVRPGTENVAGIVGVAKALELVQKTREQENKKIRNLTEYFWKELHKKIPDIKLNGPEIMERRLPNNLNVQFPRVEAEALLLYLNEAGVMCSTGSACGLESSEPSHVLRAIGLSQKAVRSSVRFSLGHKTTLSDIDYTVLQIQKSLDLLMRG